MKVLLLTQSVILQQVIRRLLGSFDVGLVACSGATEALEALAAESAELIFVMLDCDNSSRSHSQAFTSGLNGARPIPLFGLSSRKDDVLGDSRSLGITSWLRKPLTKDSVAQVLDGFRGAQAPATNEEKKRGSVTGQMKVLGFSDLVQFITYSKKTGELRFDMPGGVGSILFRDGEAEDAAFGKLDGEAAFMALSKVSDATFTLVPDVSPQRKTIHSPTMSLLMNAMREADEAVIN